MATVGKGLRGKQLDDAERAITGEGKGSKSDRKADEPKPKKTMTQAEFSGYKKGGVVGKRGWGAARCGK